MEKDLLAAIAAYCAHLRANYVAWHAEYKSAPTAADAWMQDAPGKNVVRIVHDFGSQRSSHSFVVLRDYSARGKDWKRGDILKSAEWKTPAFNFIRGNVFDPKSYAGITWSGRFN
jgi:hypothetical protein